MLEAAASGVEQNANPFFAPKMPGSNKEGISPSEFANEVFIERTITINPKSKDFVGTDTKWAISQITDWFKQAQTDLALEHSLILLSYLRTSKLEPEAMKNKEIPTGYHKLGEKICRPIPSEYPGSRPRELISDLC
jgi:hypothetical protein